MTRASDAAPDRNQRRQLGAGESQAQPGSRQTDPDLGDER